jgi:transposase
VDLCAQCRTHSSSLRRLVPSRSRRPHAAAARERGAHLVFLDESTYILTPTVRRTWAPRGSKPGRDCWDPRDWISTIGLLTLRPKRGELNLFFALPPDNANARAEHVVEFLDQLTRHRRDGFTVVWDGSTIHRRARLVEACLREHPEIVTERLPAYAPEINPNELVWGWSKYGRLPNLAAENTDVLRDHVIDELTHLQEHLSWRRKCLPKWQPTGLIG